jgi:hypothetical protein
MPVSEEDVLKMIVLDRLIADTGLVDLHLDDELPPAPPWFGEIWEEFRAASKAASERQAAPTPNPTPAKPRRQRKPRPPDGLRTAAEAAAKLGCSVKTLVGHINAGALGYVIIGHGKKRPRLRFADADLDQFIAAQTRKDSPCPSTASRARHSGTTTSSGEVVAFTARPKSPRGGKPKK